jgi:MerR family transcriptional regulator/heat shock protein HspR
MSLEQLRIRQLLADGLNLAGISVVLQLEADNARLRAKSAPRRKRDS